MTTTSNVCERTEVLSRLAALCGFNYRQSIYIPATVAVFTKAGGQGWFEVRMVEELFRNAELRAYFVEVITKADAQGPVTGWGPEQAQ